MNAQHLASFVTDTTHAIDRVSVQAMDNILGHTFGVLDHGFIRVIDYMGDDSSVVQAARVSYGTGTEAVQSDTGLINYLLRHEHTTPFEMCLSGDTRVPHFSPEGVKTKTYTMKELAEAFEQGGRENSWVKLLRIRTANPATGVVTATRIKRAWKTGTRPVYEVVTKAPFVRRIKMTDNHRVMVPGGGFSTIASGLSVGSIIMLNGVPALPEDVVSEIKDRREKGQTLKQVAEALDVSQSVVFKYGPGKAARKTGFLKKEQGQHTDPRAIARRVKELTICEAIGCEAPADHVHHVDENPHNNDLSNLMGLCAKHHKHAHHLSRLERTVGGEIESITYVGEEDVYDLETVDPNHTFVAEGIVVHNCEIKLHVKLPVFVARQWIRHRMANVNEYSARYSILDKEFYFPDPDDLAPQSKDNKQGRAGTYDQQMKDSISYVLKEGAEEAYGDYQLLIQEGDDPAADDYGYGLARELGRMVLPTNIYTQWYWKTDLHNLMRFMRLRADSHAQKEIRVYAEMIERIVAEWTPATFEAYQNYIKDVMKFSSKELETLALIMNTEQGRIMINVLKKMDVSMLQDVGTFSKGEWKEFLVKLESIEKRFK